MLGGYLCASAQMACHLTDLNSWGLPAVPVGSDRSVPEEANMNGSLLGTVVGGLVLAIAAYGVMAHYRRERRRADLLRHLDHHDWCRWTRTRH